MPKNDPSGSAKRTVTLFTEDVSHTDYATECIRHADGDCAVVSAPYPANTVSGVVNGYMPVTHGISDVGGVITLSAMSKETMSVMGDSLIPGGGFDTACFLAFSHSGRAVAFQGNLFEQLRADREALLLAVAAFLERGFEVRVLVPRGEKTLLSYLSFYPRVGIIPV